MCIYSSGRRWCVLYSSGRRWCVLYNSGSSGVYCTVEVVCIVQ